MTLFLDETCVAGLVAMDDALAAVEEAFRQSGQGRVANVPRVRTKLGRGTLRITAAVLEYRGYYGVKVSSTAVFASNAGRVFCLYSMASGELCAVVQVFALGALRTGAASGVATRYLANEDARVLGVIGSGRQARTQIEAICRVRPIELVRVFSRSKENRQNLCDDLGRAEINAEPVSEARDAVKGADVVVTATTATSPVLLGSWLEPGAHVNAIGANYEYRRELDPEAVLRAAVIATDDREQVRYEATDLAEPVAQGLLGWDDVHGLGDIVAGRVPGRKSVDDITLFKSLGVAFEDVALAAMAYERAVERGAGQTLPDLAG